MFIRRKATQRVAVIESDVLDDRRLSPAALGLYTVLAAAAPAGSTREDLLARFAIGEAGLEALLSELRAAGHVDEDVAVATAAEAATSGGLLQ